MLELNTSNCTPFLPKDWLTSRLDALESARVKLEEGSGLGGAYTGWVHLPRDYDKEEFARIQAAAERIRSDSQALVVIGIGGSYLGARAVVELLHSPNFNLTHKGGPDIYFAGNGLSSDAMLEVIEHHHRAGSSLPHLQGPAGGEVRQGGGPQAHLRHHRRPQGGPEGPGRRGGL